MAETFDLAGDAPVAWAEGDAASPCSEEPQHAASMAAASMEDAEHRSLLAMTIADPVQPRTSRTGRVLALVVTLCAACMVAVLARQSRAQTRGAARANTEEKTEYFLGEALLGVAELLHTGSKVMKDMVEDTHDLEGLFHKTELGEEFTKSEKEWLKKLNDTKVKLPPNSTWKKFLANVTDQAQLRQMLIPKMKRHDGNPCLDDEELHAGLCYKRCELPTRGLYPHRISAFSCCHRPPCFWEDVKFKMSVCGGFDVSGDMSGNKCPHPPGACLANEELHYGLCYKKCSVLTEGKFMWRVGPSTCCKFRSEAMCAGRGPGGAYSLTSVNFTTGGGLCTKEMPCAVHPPIKSMTDNKTDKTGSGEEDEEWEDIEDGEVEDTLDMTEDDGAAVVEKAKGAENSKDKGAAVLEKTKAAEGAKAEGAVVVEKARGAKAKGAAIAEKAAGSSEANAKGAAVVEKAKGAEEAKAEGAGVVEKDRGAAQAKAEGTAVVETAEGAEEAKDKGTAVVEEAEGAAEAISADVEERVTTLASDAEKAAKKAKHEASKPRQTAAMIEAEEKAIEIAERALGDAKEVVANARPERSVVDAAEAAEGASVATGAAGSAPPVVAGRSSAAAPEREAAGGS